MLEAGRSWWEANPNACLSCVSPCVTGQAPNLNHLPVRQALPMDGQALPTGRQALPTEWSAQVCGLPTYGLKSHASPCRWRKRPWPHSRPTRAQALPLSCAAPIAGRRMRCSPHPAHRWRQLCLRPLRGQAAAVAVGVGVGTARPGEVSGTLYCLGAPDPSRSC